MLPLYTAWQEVAAEDGGGRTGHERTGPDTTSARPAWASALRHERWDRRRRSVAWLARELRRLGRLHSVPLAELESLERMIRRWESGKVYPDATYRWLLASALETSEPEIFGGAEAPAVQNPLLMSHELLGRQVTLGDVAAIREITRTFRGLDNRLGGGYGLQMVSQYLGASVMRVIRDGRYSEEVGRELFGAAAELVHLTAWMAYDMELHSQARQHLGEAVQLATAAGDHAFGGEVLAGLSHHAIHLNEPDRAVELARASQQCAQRVELPALLAEGHVLEAHGHALRADAQSCGAALHRAERAFDHADKGESPEWLSYLDEAYLAARFAHCFRDLREWEHAERYARCALDMNDHYVRSRTFNTALLATSYVETDLDRACATGTEAVQLASGLQSSRSRRYIRDLQRRLDSRSHEPVVQRFNERAADFLART
jgi:hypothetical protein